MENFAKILPNDGLINIKQGDINYSVFWRTNDINRLFLMDGHYCTRPHWAKSWEDIPNIKDYLHGLLKERTERFEKVRKNYDPNGMFFDNDSIRYVFYGSP